MSIKSSVSYLLDAQENPGTLPNNIISPAHINSVKTDLQLLSDLTVSVQFNYQFTHQHQLYLDAIYYSERDTPDNYQNNASLQQASNADSYWLANLHLQSNFGQHFSAGLGANNLFDQKVYSLPLEPTSDYDNQWPGRHIELNAQWDF